MLNFCRTALNTFNKCSGHNPQPQEEYVSNESNSDQSEDCDQVEIMQVQPPFIRCRYSDFGCPKIHHPEEEPKAHERTCDYRTYTKCVILPRESKCNVRKRNRTKPSCNWIGSYHELKEHCREKHPEHLIDLMFDMPDLTKSHSVNYLISQWDFLFLLQIKVCVESGKCFHSIRMFGDSNLMDKFWCWLEVHGLQNYFSVECKILGAEKLTLDETTAGFTPIDKFLDETANVWATSMAVEIDPINYLCLNCTNRINIKVDFEFCSECFERLVKCKNHRKGCLFKDIDRTICSKHDQLFCEYRTKCFCCGVNFEGGPSMEHSCPKIIYSDINSVVRVPRDSDYILFTGHNTGPIICRKNLSKLRCQFWLCTSLPSYALKKFKCSIELTDPQTNHTQMFVPEISSTGVPVWLLEVTADDFPSWENAAIDLKINIDKI